MASSSSHRTIARQMSLGQQIASLDGRIGRLETSVQARFDAVDERFTKIDDRFEQIDQRFEQIDTRFAKIDDRFAKADEGFARIEGKLADLRTHFDVIAESWDSKFAMLYDFFMAHAERTDRRFDELTALVQANHAELRATIKMTYASLDRRVTALERRARGTGRRRH